MKATVRHAYGPPDVLQLEEVATPSPAADEVLIRVHAASIILGDIVVQNGGIYAGC